MVYVVVKEEIDEDGEFGYELVRGFEDERDAIRYSEKRCSTTGLYAGYDVVKIECEPSGYNNTRCEEDLMYIRKEEDWFDVFVYEGTRTSLGKLWDWIGGDSTMEHGPIRDAYRLYYLSKKGNKEELIMTLDREVRYVVRNGRTGICSDCSKEEFEDQFKEVSR